MKDKDSGVVDLATKRLKVDYVGSPAIAHLEMALYRVILAFPGGRPYLVGSCLSTSDWRDIDIRYIMQDAAFDAVFPFETPELAGSQLNPRWALLCATISDMLAHASDLPVDFQFQRQTQANKMYPSSNGHVRQALGLVGTIPLHTKDH